jgi:SAM-dependent methyltransferase
MNSDCSMLIDPVTGDALRREGNTLVSDTAVYPIVGGIPRFVEADNYSGDFGRQWNHFRRTQLDSHSGVPISETRLRRCLQGEANDLVGRVVLEAGSGAGRFSELLLAWGATVHSFDYSSAVEANAVNNRRHERLTLVQADIRQIPFPKAHYSLVLCIGVLQHTPDPEHSLACLWEMVAPGGVLVFDHYRPSRTTLPPPIGPAEPAYRHAMLRVPAPSRLATVTRVVNFWFPVHWALRRWRFAQALLTRVSPLHFYYPSLPLRGREAFYEWALLDTHDATTDVFKHRRSREALIASVEGLGAVDIVAARAGNGTEVFCRKPHAKGLGAR